MSTGVEVFDTTLQKTNNLLNDVCHDNDSKVVQGLLRWASPKMMNVYDEAVAPEKRTAHEKLLRKLAQRTVKRTAEGAIFVSA